MKSDLKTLVSFKNYRTAEEYDFLSPFFPGKVLALPGHTPVCM